MGRKARNTAAKPAVEVYDEGFDVPPPFKGDDEESLDSVRLHLRKSPNANKPNRSSP